MNKNTLDSTIQFGPGVYNLSETLVIDSSVKIVGYRHSVVRSAIRAFYDNAKNLLVKYRRKQNRFARTA